MYTSPTQTPTGPTSGVSSAFGCAPMLPSVVTRPPYPTARTVDQVDVYHGTSVADPYRWMEDLSDPELAPWLDAQLAITADVLGSIGCRPGFRDRLEALGRSDGLGPPVFRGGRCFQARSAAGEHGRLYLVDAPGEPGRMVFDTHVSDDVVVSDIEPSPDGRLLKWCESVGGSDWRTWHFLDVDSGERLPDVIEGTKLWSRWMPASDGLLYIAFPSSEAGATRKTAVPQLKLHRLGTPASDDVLIYENPASPSYFFPSVTDDRIVLTFLYEPGSSSRGRRSAVHTTSRGSSAARISCGWSGRPATRSTSRRRTTRRTGVCSPSTRWTDRRAWSSPRVSSHFRWSTGRRSSARICSSRASNSAEA